MNPTDVIERAGLPTGPTRRLSGGDIAETWQVGDWVVKGLPDAPTGFFEAEARGLASLAAHGVPVPQVHHVDAAAIVLSYLPPGPPDAERLGRSIAAMHANAGVVHGRPTPGFLGRLPLPSGTSSSWREHLVAHRIQPLLRQAAPHLGSLASRAEGLAARIDLPDEGPRLLHGDLWAGNVVHAASGPHLIDPAAQWGERVYDLAMMELFGGFTGRCRDAYEEALPLGPGVRSTIRFHQLVFLLAHVALFGSGYVPAVRDVLTEYGA